MSLTPRVRRACACYRSGRAGATWWAARAESQRRAELTPKDQCEASGGPGQQREFAKLPGSHWPEKGSEDRPLLTSVVAEVGTKVCDPKLNEKSYFPARGQQEAAEDKRLYRRLPWLTGQGKCFPDPSWEARGSRGRPREGEKTSHAVCIDLIFTWMSCTLNREKLSRNPFLHFRTKFVSLF